MALVNVNHGDNYLKEILAFVYYASMSRINPKIYVGGYFLIRSVFFVSKGNLFYVNLTTLWAYSADDKVMILIFFFPENRIWHFMQTVSIGDDLHKMSNPVFWEKEEK